MFVKFLLKDQYQNNFTLKHARNIEQAQAHLSSTGVDVILLDDKLGGGMTSADAIPLLQKKAFNVPIVIISKEIRSRHLEDRARMGTNKVVDKFALRAELANGLLD